MRRRYFLATVGASLAAGCGSTSDETPLSTPEPENDNPSNPSQNSANSTPKPEPDPTPESTPEPEPDPDIDVVSSSILTDDRDRKWVRGEFRNVSNVDHGRYRANYGVRDSNGQVVDSQERFISMIPAGETWVDYTLVFGTNRDAAATVEVTPLTTDGDVVPPELGGINILSSTLSKDFRGLTEVTGELRNDGSDRSILVLALIHTSDGVLRGSVQTYVRDVSSGATRPFRAALASHWTPRTNEDALPTEYEVYAFGSVP